MDLIKQFIHEQGYSFEPEILDGTKREFKTDTHKGWYVGEEKEPGKWVFTFGDWKTGEKFHTKIGFKQTPEEKAKLKQAKLEHDKATKAKHKHTQSRATELFNSGSTLLLSPYLTNKKVIQPKGVHTRINEKNKIELLIPMYEDTTMWNIQTIQENGFKAFLPGGRTKGLYHWIGGIPDTLPTTIYICEGYATAVSVHMAVGEGVICAFSASNLKAVVEHFIDNWNLKIVVCADNDHLKKDNPGLRASQSCLIAANVSMILPKFDARELGSDFNDLLVSKGIDFVKEHFTTPTPIQKPVGVLEKYINGVQPMELSYSKKGNPILPPELDVADHVRSYYGDKIIVFEGKDIFIYTGKYWRLLDTNDISQIKIQIQSACHGLLTHNRVLSIYNLFLIILPKAPTNIFIPNPYKINLDNGTLHISGKHSQWKVEFKPHNKSDYCINLIPIEYDPTKRNETFETMVSEILGEDPEKDEKIRAVQEMYGACLAPIFPHIFFIHGPGNKGKTALVLPIMRLLGMDNICSVEPHEFSGFLMESMAGKLINIVTDIDIYEPIKDAHIKKIEDRVPFRIDRKFLKPIYAPLPAIHIFCGNDLPAAYDRGSGAFDRRVTALHVHTYTPPKNANKNFANDVFAVCPAGVLNWALAGLDRLLKFNGVFKPPESSKEQVREWQLAKDPIGLFLDEIGSGESEVLVRDSAGSVERKRIWDLFVSWCENTYNKKPWVSRIMFFKRLYGLGASIKTISGRHYVTGFRLHGSIGDDNARL